MKTDRLMAILILLTKQQMVTAPFLAEHFEVSRRTINRDIESLCMAGIPIITKQGKNGGISIQEGYKLDKNILSKSDLNNILIGLKAINTVNNSSDISLLIKKIAPQSDNIEQDDIIKIDLASFYKGSIAPKIEKIKNAIAKKQQIQYTYYSKKKESERCVEPYHIIYRWDGWYLYGFCTLREDFRIFKLNRLWDLEVLEKTFIKRNIEYDKLDYDSHIKDDIKIEAIFDADCKYLLIDAYGPRCFGILDDGRLYYKGSYSNHEYILRWILSFGDKVLVIKPVRLIEDINKNAQNIIGKYRL